MARKIQPCVLTIAGSDSGGNAGVQADLRAFHCYGLHGCTVFAALTAQNPRGVRSVLDVPAAFIADQLDAVFEMYNVRALKTGMLATPEAIEVVAERLRAAPPQLRADEHRIDHRRVVRQEEERHALGQRLQPLDRDRVAPPEYPLAHAAQHGAVVEDEDERHDRQHGREEQEERARTEERAHGDIRERGEHHEEERHLVEVREHRVEPRPLHDLLDLRVER